MGSESIGHKFMKKAALFIAEILFKFGNISADKQDKVPVVILYPYVNFS